jgi:hypothetical protein
MTGPTGGAQCEKNLLVLGRTWLHPKSSFASCDLPCQGNLLAGDLLLFSPGTSLSLYGLWAQELTGLSPKTTPDDARWVKDVRQPNV